MQSYCVRIINADFYMAPPSQELDVVYSEFRGATVAQVPIVRVFGTTDSGKKICLHVHGVFPYFYIPYDGKEDANGLMYQIAANIDKAVNISFGQASSTTQHVFKISLVSGIPFYGYHTRNHQFFRVYLYNPALIRKVSNLLQKEVISGKMYQPHESHIPYILQFMIDYNLHGMSKINLKKINFRLYGDELIQNCETSVLPNSFIKMSICEIEGDTLAENILNRFEVSSGKLVANPGIAALWEDERQRRRNKNDDSQIGPCLTLSNRAVPPTKSHTVFKKALQDRLAILEDTTSADSTDSNISIYPAETPQNVNVLNASLIDFETPSSSETICDKSILDLNVSLDEDARNLFEILQELRDEDLPKEEDSILSQLPKEDYDEDDLDLSVSLGETTPMKILAEDENEDFNSDEDLWNSSLDKTLIPQVDGNYDSDSTDKKNPDRSKSKIKSKYKPLPVEITTPSQHANLTQTKSDNLEKVKRQLEFEQTPNFDQTFVEDNVECKLKRKKVDDNLLVNFETSRNKNQILKDYFSLDDHYTHEDQDEFSVAEVYDRQFSFVPKEGSSKLTQNSNNSELIPSGSKKIEETPNFADFEFERDVNEDVHVSFRPETSIIGPQRKAPSRGDVLKSLPSLKIPLNKHQTPFYSNPEDVTGNVEIGYMVLKVPSKSTADLEDFNSFYDALNSLRKPLIPENFKPSFETVKNLKLSYCKNSNCVVTPLQQPPTRKDVLKWLETKQKISEQDVKPVKKIEKTKVYLPSSPNDNKMDESDLDLTLTLSPCEDDVDVHKPIKKSDYSSEDSSKITGVTLDNTYGFKMTPENYQEVKAVNVRQFLTILATEAHVRTRGDFKPDPAYDPIRAIFYAILEDDPQEASKLGIIVVNSVEFPTSENFLILKGIPLDNYSSVNYVKSEEELFEEFIKLVQNLDPDILAGYEVELLSWGYLIDRASILGLNLVSSLSRIQNKNTTRHYDKDDKGLRITGRIILDVWRLLRHEIALQSYTFESIAYHILHKRVPLYSFKDLNFWWEHPTHLYRNRTFNHYVFRVESTLDILQQLDLIGRTSELARLFGILFFEVLSRGSQFRVESMMLRLAKPMNYIAVSPSVEQRAQMRAPEFLALILEPESKFYVDPVIVLDFQSLYPSIIIAYNYCFSTCIGKVQHLGKNSAFPFGATQYKISRKRLQKLVEDDCLNLSPCGVGFVKSHLRDGILPRMLREILDTRLMVKASMKENKGDAILQKVLHNRQLGLKLIANVTYGYSAANFSGRMPAVELADSVVSKGRETLQRAIALLENTPEWGAKVVYGDTDSLFVMVPGKSKDEAFEVGKKIAQAVTDDNPDPVKLKLEKVYWPCILQTKKRYVGYMYESPDQVEPVYNAKGIETVRRDGCPAVAKMLEKCLRLLFETKNVSLVKKYVLKQFHKIVAGRVSLQDLTFAKEYRGAAGYRPGACVPALELTRKWTAVDRRNEPRSSERVPYIIANGPPGLPLIRLVRSPRDFLNDPTLRPNALYYITKVIIPPINRCFKLIGVDLNLWFNNMPRQQFVYLPTSSSSSSPVRRNTIAQYFSSASCAVCGRQTQTGLCENCFKQPQKSCVILAEKIRTWERANYQVKEICQSCCGLFDANACISLDCPVIYRLNQTERSYQQATFVRQLLEAPQFQF